MAPLHPYARRSTVRVLDGFMADKEDPSLELVIPALIKAIEPFLQGKEEDRPHLEPQDKEADCSEHHWM